MKCARVDSALDGSNMKNKPTIKIVLLILLLLVVVIVGIGIFLMNRNVEPQGIVEVPTLQSRFLLSDNTKVSLSTKLFGDDGVIENYQYNEVLDFVDGNAVVTKKNVIYYVQFNNEGKVAREVELGIRPDMVLSMARKVLVNGEDTYYLMVIPLRGFRLFKIAADSTITENYYPVNEFFKLYSDNVPFISNNKIFIPNGGLSLYSIDLSSLALGSSTIDPQLCGAGTWSINHNYKNLFVLTSATQICVFNFDISKAVNTFPLSGNLWCRIVPELKLLLVENWEMHNNFPASKGTVAIYSLESGENISNIDLSINAEFLAERGGSPGGYSLIGDTYVLNSNELHLFTRAGKGSYALTLNEVYEMKEFKPVSNFNYGRTFDLQQTQD